MICSKKKYDDYLSFLWIPLNNESRKFISIDRIIITKANNSQVVRSRVQHRQLDWSDYTGTLLFDDSRLDLLTRNDKKDLLKGLKEIADFLKVGIEDRTTHVYYWVDFSKVEK